MKTLLKLSLSILLFLTVLSCSKNDDLSPNSNTIEMDGESFSVVSASITGISIGDDGHTGITFSNASDLQVKTLTIDVESFTEETIEGNYSYPANEDDKLLDDWLTNYTYFAGTTSTSSNLESGTVSIVNNGGNNYTIDMNLTMNDGATFVGSYTGDFIVMFSNN